MSADYVTKSHKPVPSWPGKRRPQLADEVAQYVRALILSGEVEQGSFLRLERLANELGISATPVREALAALEREGFVRLKPRRGYVVSRLSRQDINDLFMVETFVESELVARAARYITPERLGELHAIFDELLELIEIGKFDEAEDATFRFYWLIHDAARSPKLSWLVSTIVPYSPHGYISTPGLRENTVRSFSAVLRALDEHDSEAARAAIEQHVQRGCENFVAFFEARGLWKDEPAKDDPTEGARL